MAVGEVQRSLFSLLFGLSLGFLTFAFGILLIVGFSLLLGHFLHGFVEGYVLLRAVELLVGVGVEPHHEDVGLRAPGAVRAVAVAV